MDGLRLLAICCCITSIAVKEIYGYQSYTSRLVEVKMPSVIDLLKYVEQDIDYRYSDFKNKLTAIKSKQHKACYVNDYDPLWNPTDDDLKLLALERKPKAVVDFGAIVGDVITHMCSKLEVYWLADEALNRSPIQRSVNNASPVLIQSNPQPKELPNVYGNMRIQSRQTSAVPIKKPDDFGLVPGAPPIQQGGLIEPPLLNPRNEAIVGPSRVVGGGDLFKPPIVGPGNSGFIEPPLINNGGEGLIEPPLINPGNEALIEPPLINNNNGLIEPPLINPGFSDNNGFLEPPRLFPGNNVIPGQTNFGGKPNSGLFINSLQNYKRSGGSKTTPSKASLLKMLKDFEANFGAKETKAPPTPDFRTPAFRRIY